MLYEDAVIGGVRNSVWAGKLSALVAAGIGVHLLEADLEARGIAQSRLASGIDVISHADFVGLVVQHPTVQAW
jgi:sulfur relay protein TusB/DsrH